MLLRQLWLTDFRSYATAEVELAEGLTAVVGPNGEGKTNLLEAIGYLATLGSFRGAPNDALVRQGATTAVLRAEGEREGRKVLIEAELSPTGRSRVMVNRQRLARTRDLLGALRVSVFSPDDLSLVKGGPSERRRFLDDALVSVHPRHDVLRSDLDKVLRQRNALLRSVASRPGGRRGDLEEADAHTLAVWDSKLAELGEALADARADLLAGLSPVLAGAYDRLASRAAEVTATYEAPWRADGLAAAIEKARPDELRRGVSLVGPHRDEVTFTIGGLPARTHASQGEQRSLALALRLAVHELVSSSVGEPPILLLDDVFSELDADRSHALLTNLPPGQTVLSTAAGLPPGAVPERTLVVGAGEVRPGPE